MKFKGGGFNQSDPMHIKKFQEILQEGQKQSKELEKLRKQYSQLKKEYENLNVSENQEDDILSVNKYF